MRQPLYFIMGLSHLVKPKKSKIKTSPNKARTVNETANRLKSYGFLQFKWTFSTAVFKARRIYIRLTP